MKIPTIIKNEDGKYTITDSHKNTSIVQGHVKVRHLGQTNTAEKWYEMSQANA